MDHLKLTPDVLSVDAITDLVVDASCEAVSVFVGTTRDSSEGKSVMKLYYEACEPMALKEMKCICKEIRKQWPAIHSIAIYHRLGTVLPREASVVIAVSSPHRQDSLQAVGACIDKLIAMEPVWKQEVYSDGSVQGPQPIEIQCGSENENDLVHINVSNEEMNLRIQNFINLKRDQVNINNIHDFIPGKIDTEDGETCARVRSKFVKRSDSKGHLKISKVVNEYGPQTIQNVSLPPPPTAEGSSLPHAVSERILNLEKYMYIQPVSKDIYKRLKEIEDRVTVLQAQSPEYSHFWNRGKSVEVKQEYKKDYIFSSDDIAKKIELFQRHESRKK